MEYIYEDYKNNEISLEDVYKKCRKQLCQSKENALISTCLTLVTLIPSSVLLRKYKDIVDVFINEKEFIYNLLYEESPKLARKFTSCFGDQKLMNPVEFYWRYELRTK